MNIPASRSFGDRTLQATEPAKAAAINPANSPEQKLADETEKRTRIPMSVPRAKLTTPEIPGHHTHWINDYSGRILQAQQGGYEFVSQQEALITTSDVAGLAIGQGTDLGSRVSVVVGKNDDGTPLRAYLMKVRNEWYESDQAQTQARVDAIDEAMRQGKQAVDGDGSNRYVKTVQMKSTYSRRG
jgi:hypothetical protein